MKVYLVRHGEAVSEVVDPARPLSEKGRKEAGKVAAFLKQADISVEKVFHSGKKRAFETAGIIAEELSTEIDQREGLMPGDDVSVCARWLEGLASSGGEDLMLVGHLPFMGYLVGMMVNGELNDGVVQFETATVVCLERAMEGKWVIRFVVEPGVLG